MKYNAPAGAEPDAPYLDGNRNAGVKGSVPPAAAIEHPQRELVHLINFAGLAPDAADLEQVRKAIEALISAATGGGDTSQFLLVSQARARLPIFPEILSSDGKMNVSSPAAGSILVPPTVSFMHRGIFPVNTSDYTELQRTFATDANKTYHLRWDPTNGFRLCDLADATYNPGSLAETEPSFDSSYDDMLAARVVTNSSNVATITNLINRPVIKHTYSRGTLVYSVNWASSGETNEIITYDFARTPMWVMNGFAESGINSPPPNNNDGDETNMFLNSASRYVGSVAAWSYNAVNNRAGRPQYRATFLAIG